MTRRTARRRASILRALTTLLLAAVAAGVIGFGWFVHAAESTGDPPPHADGIVALTGGAERIETALLLLEAGRAKLLLVSGVAHSAALPALAHRVDLDPASIAPRVTLGRNATSTFGNAEETAAWVGEHDIHSLIVVTAGYHMQRALLELGRALPGITLYPVPVQPQGLHPVAKLRLLIAEYVRLVAAACGMSQIVHVRAS